ncbi:hypothetical protein GOODEAATRI_008431 [Goodea atripinnis]|uniref:Uncharacterized protein n=1 Tax=Goodea atripinnis TaxID=208336 RepID=A0ABV0N8Z9_9TELE
MKRFRRHGQESQRDRLKQELFHFTKASSVLLGTKLRITGGRWCNKYVSQVQEILNYIKSEFFIINLDMILYGAPGVEFMGLHDENAAVTQVFFMPHQVQ